MWTCFELDGFKGLLICDFFISKEQFLKRRLNTLMLLDLFLNIQNCVRRIHLKRHRVTIRHLDSDAVSLLCYKTNIVAAGFLFNLFKAIHVMDLLTIEEKFKQLLFNTFLLTDPLLDVQDSVNSQHRELVVFSSRQMNINVNSLLAD